MLEEMVRRLDVVDTSILLQHEEIVPKNLKRLKEAMFNIGQMVDPIIMDEKEHVVLDGNHRMTVLKDMECPHAAVQPVDYEDPKIELGTWYPCSRTFEVGQFQGAGVEMEKVDFNAGMDALNESRAAFMLGKKNGQGKEAWLLSPGKYSTIKELLEAQKAVVDSTGVSTNPDVTYVADDFGDTILNDGLSALYRRAYTKKEVVERAKSGVPFPPKSTRHLIPNRVVRLNMKLGWLFENKDEARRLMLEMLKNRVYSGNVRRYPEPVIVIY
ncbi:MAG: hypothetical protein PHQ80_00635 [Candidatus ainarchaeum sp.]|nr:hypothetical protein [Candidatus ainarchaeum sp.]